MRLLLETSSGSRDNSYFPNHSQLDTHLFVLILAQARFNGLVQGRTLSPHKKGIASVVHQGDPFRMSHYFGSPREVSTKEMRLLLETSSGSRDKSYFPHHSQLDTHLFVLILAQARFNGLVQGRTLSPHKKGIASVVHQ
eukprot:scaffold6355_cov119-Cylindrotheca_fusiformis.AAC.1